MSGHKPWSNISAKVRANPARRARIEQREQAICNGIWPVEDTESKHVMDSAKRAIKKYRTDLEYLRDR